MNPATIGVWGISPELHLLNVISRGVALCFWELAATAALKDSELE